MAVMELRHLRYFVAVARELNFSRAAEALHVAQPAVSRQIRQLEEEMAVVLIERNSGHVRLTDAGRVFLEHVERWLMQLDIAITATQEAHRGTGGRLVISNDWRLMVGVIPESVLAFRERYPRVDVDLIDLPIGEQIAALRTGQVHLGFMPRDLFSSREDLETLSVLSSDVIAALPANHRLAGKSSIRLVDLRSETWLWIKNPTAPNHRQSISQLCRLAGFRPKFGKSVPSLQSLFGLVASGYGVAILPSCVVPSGQSHVCNVATDCEPIEILAVWRRDDESVTLRHFLDIVRERLS